MDILCYVPVKWLDNEKDLLILQKYGSCEEEGTSIAMQRKKPELCRVFFSSPRKILQKRM